MPRRLRVAGGGYAYHVLDRAVGRMRIFAKRRDFEAFEEVIVQAKERGPAADAPTLAAARANSANGSRTGGAASVGGSRRAVWRGVVAGADREATGPAIDIASPRPPLAVARQVNIKTPDPIPFGTRFALNQGTLHKIVRLARSFVLMHNAMYGATRPTTPQAQR